MHGYAPREYSQLLTESKEGDWLECENELSFITEQGREVRLRGTTRDRTGPAYCRPGSAWLGDVEREVLVYTLVVSDPKLRCNKKFVIIVSVFL